MTNDNQIRYLADKIIQELWSTQNTAALAGLRVAKNINDPQTTKVWPVIFRYLPKKLLSQNGKPTYAEIAIFETLKAFSTYEQGPNKPLLHSQKAPTLMKALNQLRNSDPEHKDALDRRIQNLLSTRQTESFLNQLQSLISIMKSRLNNQTIDFSQLAKDLYLFQIRKGAYIGSQQIILQWGQDYYSTALN